MHGIWLLIHNLGYTFWLGGGVASMVAGIVAKRFAPAERLAAYQVTGTIQRILVGPGALASAVSGLALIMPYMKEGTGGGWMHSMMGFGLLGTIVTVTLSVPTAARLARLQLDPRGELPEYFPALRKRLVWTATIGGGLGLLAMVSATVLR